MQSGRKSGGMARKLSFLHFGMEARPRLTRQNCTVMTVHSSDVALHRQAGHGIDAARRLCSRVCRGQTSEIIFNHEIYNYIDRNSERWVSDMIWFGTALPEEVWKNG